MKVLQFVCRDPNGNMEVLNLDAATHKVQTEHGFLRLKKGDELLLIVPSHKIERVAFSEAPDQPRIISPHEVIPGNFGPKVGENPS